ncbi:GtrA family protein [uncultured Bacteroides sp.]|uniref:GtrA family protein n=1 Tax=uncultured Bacteroides sp. TaxID=162156 RepID=UPI002AA621C5|nr:GtrA family protein [uncultured Bacteroides sp.]
MGSSQSILRKETSRFAFVGIICTVLHYAIYYILKEYIGFNIAYTIGYVSSFFLNLVLSSKFTFHAIITVKKCFGFGLSHLINYGLHILLLNLFVYIGISKTLAPIPVYAIAIPVNFILVRIVLKSNRL